MGKRHPPPVIILPNFRWRPERVVGTPVVLAIFLFAFVIPNAFFQLNDSPGTPVLLPLFLLATTIPPIQLIPASACTLIFNLFSCHSRGSNAFLYLHQSLALILFQFLPQSQH